LVWVGPSPAGGVSRPGSAGVFGDNFEPWRSQGLVSGVDGPFNEPHRRQAPAVGGDGSRDPLHHGRDVRQVDTEQLGDALRRRGDRPCAPIGSTRALRELHHLSEQPNRKANTGSWTRSQKVVAPVGVGQLPKSVSGLLALHASTRDEPVNLSDSRPETHQHGRQPMLIAASRCHLIQMLRSALTCTNGCSCWSPHENNRPQIFLTMDALYRLS
jgi:hypothetical protein